jgi:phospholipase C
MKNLEKIDHVVVLMLENRSFDHMLGYLSLRGRDIDGLRHDMANAWGGRSYGVAEQSDTSIEVGPGHGHDDVLEQLGLVDGATTPSMRGFVKNYARHVLGTRRLPDVMGYYTATQLPVYDFLAREFCVCDRWFCSFPGPTWPNRFFAYAGQSGGVTKNLDPVDLRTVFDVLDERNVSWQYYSHDIAFIRTMPRFRARGRNQGIAKIGAFGQALQRGTLPSFSWIDPNFTLVTAPLHFSFANDDHPPADIRRGQKLVSSVYNAIRQSSYWEKTLLVVAYDEHGGFYDHVPPPTCVSPDGSPTFGRLGPRVPALLVSPWLVRGSVDSVTRDHTSIIKTVLNRFAPGLPDGAVRLGARVAQWANDLDGTAAGESRQISWHGAPRKDCPGAPNVDVADTSSTALSFRRGAARDGSPRQFGELEATEMQEEMLGLAERVTAEGVPEDQL